MEQCQSTTLATLNRKQVGAYNNLLNIAERLKCHKLDFSLTELQNGTLGWDYTGVVVYCLPLYS